MKRALFVVLAACGGGGGGADAGPEADARIAELEGPCPFEERVGVFEAKHLANVSVVGGKVLDGVIPAEIPTVEHEEGGCAYLRKVFPFCDPPCQPTETCDQAGACIAAPLQQDAGTITVTGLLEAVVMEPNQFNEYEDSDVPAPPFAVGATIALSAAGDAVEGFVLDGLGVPPLVVSDTTWTMRRDEAMTIEWTASDGPGDIHVSLNVDLHGNSPVTMFCDFPDTGSATIPVPMVNRLIDFGITVGFASATIARRTVDHTDIDEGCVEMRVFSQIDPQFALE